MKKFLAILIFLTTLVLQGWGDTEPNNSCVQAETWTTLTARGQSSSSMTGNVSSSDQNDYYKIVLSTSGSLQISGNSNQNTNYYILNSSCTQLTSQTNTKTPNLTYTAAAGTYYLRINRNGNSTYSNMIATLDYVDGERSFTPIYTSNTRGGVKIIGNSNLCLLSGGACIEPASTSNNDSGSNIGYWNVASNGSTFNSTTADITLLSGSKILFAGLYWQGYVDKRDKSKINQIKFKKPNGSYQTLTASRVDTLNGGKNYQSFVDVTSQIDVNNPNGTYAVADIMADIYADANSASVDNYAAWAMFVVYENPSESLKNVTIWDGYDSISSGSTTITASGFRTPLSGAINSSFLIFSTEGDVQSTGDYIQINNVYLKDALNPAPPPNGTATNAFNSTISSFGTNVDARNPAYPNTLGIDVDEFNVSSILSNNQTSATIRIGTSGDAFYVSAFAFSTEIYSPAIGNFDKNVSVTYASSKTCEGNQDLRGATLNYEVSFENTGTEAASNVRVYDDFQSNGILNYFDMTQTSIPTAQLLSGTAASTITCDKNATAVYCDFNRINIGTKYKINFAAKIKNTLIIADDLNISNTANAHYYNASTGEEITQIASSNMEVAGGICSTIPIAEYRMDECSWNGLTGEVKDSIGTNHGTSKSNNSSAPAVATTVDTWQINRAGEFKGEGYTADPNSSWYEADYYIEIPDNSTLSPLSDTKGMTISGWFKPDNTNAQTIIHKGNGSVQEYSVYIENNRLNFTVWNQNNSPSTITVDTTTLSSNQTYFFAATAEIDTSSNELSLNLYLKNGTNSYSKTGAFASFVYPSTPGSLYIGAVKWGDFSGYFDGLIDEIKLFSSALSSDSITKIFNNDSSNKNYDGTSRSSVNCDLKPVADYRFDECQWKGTIGEVEDNASSYNGTLKNKTMILEEGQINLAATQFDDDSYVELPNFPNLAGSMTITAWFKTNNISEAGQRIFADDQSNTNGYAISVGDGGNGSIRYYDRTQTNSGIIDSDSILQNGTWYFVAGVTDITNAIRHLYLYDNSGNLINHKTLAMSNTSRGVDTGVATIGGEPVGGETANRFKGSIDEVKIFDKALSQAQITGIYTNELSGQNYDGTSREVSCCCVPTDGNLIANPSFETLCGASIIQTFGNVAGGTVNMRSNICGWNMNGVGMETWENTTLPLASNGTVFVEIDGYDTTVDQLSQNLNTLIGTHYVISFDYRARNGGSDRIIAKWNGTEIGTFTGITTGWQTAQIEVVGTGSDTLAFEEPSADNDSYGSWIDNIRLNEGTLATDCTSFSYDLYHRQDSTLTPINRLHTRLFNTPFDVNATVTCAGTDTIPARKITKIYAVNGTCPTVTTGLTPIWAGSMDINDTQKTITIPSLNIPKAYQNIHLMLETNASELNCSTDTLAIRPIGYTLSSSSLKAGDTVNTSTSAGGSYNGEANVTTTLQIPNANCTTQGNFLSENDLPPLQFVNDANNSTLIAKDIGNINVTITDKTWTAIDNPNDCIVDSNITSYSGLSGKIGCEINTTIPLSINPYELNTTLQSFTVPGTGSQPWLYLDSSRTQNVEINTTIEAFAKDGTKTKNFSDGCVGASVPIGFYFSPATISLSDMNISLTSTTGSTSAISNSNTTYSTAFNSQSFSIPNTSFKNGDANLSLEFNFMRPITPLNPFDLNLTAIKTSYGSGVKDNNTSLDKNATFVYGRVHAYDIKTDQILVPNPIEIEIYGKNSNHPLLNGKPQNVLYWYRNTDHDNNISGAIGTSNHSNDYKTGTNTPNITITTPDQPSNGIHTIEINNATEIKEKQKITLDIPSWLTIAPANNTFTYQYIPSSTTTDKLSEPSKGVNSGTFTGSDFEIQQSQQTTKKGIKVFR